MKHIDLDALPWFSKQQVAEHQLDRAIRLLLGEGDAISAVNLAGAAEEILGELVSTSSGSQQANTSIAIPIGGNRVAENAANTRRREA